MTQITQNHITKNFCVNLRDLRENIRTFLPGEIPMGGRISLLLCPAQKRAVPLVTILEASSAWCHW
jgi:hypothetical protein